MVIYHIATDEAWDQAKAAGWYTHPSMESEGFIHASTLDQIVDTANRHFRGVSDLKLLAIDVDTVEPEVRFEPVYINEQEQEFPHIYGPINLNAIVEIIDFPAEKDGTFTLPDALTRRY